MTTYYGSLVGTPKQAAKPNLISSTLERGTDHVLVRDKYELATMVFTNKIQAAVLPWETVLDPYGSNFSFDDLGTGNTISLGDVTYANALCNAQDTATAAGTALALKSVDIDNYFKPLWQQLGYATLAAAKLIGAQCELLFTLNTANGTGTLVWQLKGQAR